MRPGCIESSAQIQLPMESKGDKAMQLANVTAKIAALVYAVGATCVPLSAHHAFAAEFDSKQPVKLTGVVTKMEWINPHSWIHIDVKNPDGTTTNWMIEGGSPNTLFRRGFNQKSLPNGITIVVDGYRSKDGSFKANGRDVTFPDGRKLFLGGSNPDEQPGYTK
jgi:Family of unknown function (DUF6152)